MSYHRDPTADPYLQEADSDADTDSEAEAWRIRDSDLLILAARNEDDVSHLEVRWQRVRGRWRCECGSVDGRGSAAAAQHPPIGAAEGSLADGCCCLEACRVNHSGSGTAGPQRAQHPLPRACPTACPLGSLRLRLGRCPRRRPSSHPSSCSHITSTASPCTPPADPPPPPPPQVWVYEEADERGPANLYVHHSLMLPAFPLAVTWLDCDPTGRVSGGRVTGGGGGGLCVHQGRFMRSEGYWVVCLRGVLCGPRDLQAHAQGGACGLGWLAGGEATREGLGVHAASVHAAQ